MLAHVERAWLQLKLCSTYLFYKVIFAWNMWNIFSPWCKHHPHHYVMIVVGHTLNEAFNKKSRRLASTFVLEGGAGEGPREMSTIIEVYIVYEGKQFRR